MLEPYRAGKGELKLRKKMVVGSRLKHFSCLSMPGGRAGEESDSSFHTA